LAVKLGLAISTLARGGDVVVGCDYRLSSESLKSALCSALTLGGSNVLDLGYAATPCIAFAGRESKAEFSIAVTASHNPPSDNGFKVFAGEGYESTLELEKQIEDLTLGENFALADWKAAGRVTKSIGPLNQYAARLLDLPPLEGKLRVVVDCSNGTASGLTPKLLHQMGGEVGAINNVPDGRFPGRLPEPTPENLEGLSRRVVGEKADLGIAHDGDADRLAIIDERGRYVNNDTLLAYFASMLMRRHGSGKVITSVDTSFRIDETVAKIGGSTERTRLGKTHSRLLDADRDVIRLCCEPWKVIDPKWGYWGDAIYAAITFALEVAKSGQSVSELLASIPDYPQERIAFDCLEHVKLGAMNEIESVLREAPNVLSVWSFDGVRVNFKDGAWVLARPSGTEPRIRAYLEAKNGVRLSELHVWASKAITDAIRKAS
jgi:phosphomannomutase